MKRYTNIVRYNDRMKIVVMKNRRAVLFIDDSGFNSINSCISEAVNRLSVCYKDNLETLSFDIWNMDRETGGSYDYKGRRID